MNKKNCLILSIISFCIAGLILFALVSHCFSKEIDLSLTANIGYGHAKWGSGGMVQPGGSMNKSIPIFNPSAQIKFTRWPIQPTLEFSYRWANYDFDTWQAPVQTMEPRAWSVLGGITYDFKLFTAYGLLGYTNYQANVSLIEVVQYKKCHKIKSKLLYHGENIGFESDLLTYKIGAYKIFKIGPIKAGPEVSLQGWNIRPGWSRCREGKENIVQPNVGIRIQL